MNTKDEIVKVENSMVKLNFSFSSIRKVCRCQNVEYIQQVPMQEWKNFMFAVFFPIAAKLNHISTLDALYNIYIQLNDLIPFPNVILQTMEYIVLQRGHVEGLQWLIRHGSNIKSMNYPHVIYNWKALDWLIRRGTSFDKTSKISSMWKHHTGKCYKPGLLIYMSKHNFADYYIEKKCKYYFHLFTFLKDIVGDIVLNLIFEYID